MPAASPTWSFRLGRATAFAAVCLALGSGAHLIAGGMLSVRGLAGGLALTLAVALPLSMREGTPTVILPVLAAVQAGLHVHFCVADAPSLAEAAGHLHHHACCDLVPGPGMLMMHGWAVGLAALWLARGEAIVWALLRRAGARLRRLIRPPAPRRYAVVRPGRPAEPAVLRSAVPRCALRLRGPPRAQIAVSY